MLPKSPDDELSVAKNKNKNKKISGVFGYKYLTFMISLMSVTNTTM